MKNIIVTIFTGIIFLVGGTGTAKAATMNVSHNSTLSWSASYQIKTSGNHILDVSNIKVSSKIGSITGKYITHDSPNRVTLHITRNVGVIKYHVTLSAKMDKGKLFVTAD